MVGKISESSFQQNLPWIFIIFLEGAEPKLLYEGQTACSKFQIVKRKIYQLDLSSLYVFWYEWDNSRVYVFIHVCSKFHVSSMYVMKLK